MIVDFEENKFFFKKERKMIDGLGLEGLSF